jgi:hypothetical protein
MALSPCRAAVGFLALVSIGVSCVHIGVTSDSPVAGLPRAGEPAVIFAPGVISTGDVFASTFTPDGRTVVFTRFSPPKMTLMTSAYRDGRWSAPSALPFSGTYRDLDPAFDPDGTRLFFSSWRPTGPSSADTTNASDTWYVDRTGAGWSSPVHLREPVNAPEQDYYPSAARNALYFDSFRSHGGPRSVFRAARRADGDYDRPVALPPVINADSGASNLFVDPDERYVIFGAARPGGRGGIDLYIGRRVGDSWTEPRNLGDLVNTKDTEFCPFVSRDGKYLFFTRNVVVNGQASRNIYVVRFDALLNNELRSPSE